MAFLTKILSLLLKLKPVTAFFGKLFGWIFSGFKNFAITVLVLLCLSLAYRQWNYNSLQEDYDAVVEDKNLMSSQIAQIQTVMLQVRDSLITTKKDKGYYSRQWNLTKDSLIESSNKAQLLQDITHQNQRLFLTFRDTLRYKDREILRLQKIIEKYDKRKK